MDPKILNDQIEYFYNREIDYCYSGLSFSKSICSDLFSFDALRKTFQESTEKDDRDYVTPCFHKHKELFKITN